MFVSAELVVIGALQDAFPGFRVQRQTELDLQQSLPVITAVRIPSVGAGVNMDRPLVDVDVYAARWAEADLLMLDVRAFFYRVFPGMQVVTATGVGQVHDVEESSSPAQRPVSDPGLFRCGGTWRLAVKQIVAA